MPEGNSVLHLGWEHLGTEHLNDKLDRQFVNCGHMTVARFLLRRGVLVPRHSHPNQQVAIVLSGRLKFVFDDHEVTVAAGEALVIPPGVPHAAEALEDTIDVDVFHPSRSDWSEKRDSYLR